MRSLSLTKRVSAIIPVNRDCVTFLFKDGTNTTLTYMELRESWNEMIGLEPEMVAPTRLDNTDEDRTGPAKPHSVQVREPVAHRRAPKLHPLAKPRSMTFD